MSSHGSLSSSVRHVLAVGAAVSTALGSLSAVSIAASPSTMPASGPVRLTSSRHLAIPDARILSMSPDGNRIAALRPAVGFQHGELCTFDSSSLAEVACASLHPLEAGLRLESVAWSPDSGHLVMAEEAFNFLKDGDLWLMDATTGALTNLDDDGYAGQLPFGGKGTAATITVPATPTFTPDGTSVTYSRSTFRDGRPAGNDIATVPVGGGPATHLVDVSPTTPGLVYFGMRWAPDGERLYYSVDDVSATSPVNGIWAVDADGTGLRLVAGTTDAIVGEPAVAQVSRDGQRLLGWHPRAAGQLVPPYNMSLIDTATGVARPLTIDRDPDVQGSPAIQMATISPDGTWLIEVAEHTDPDHQVRLTELATGEVTALLPDALPIGGPSQSGTVPTWATNGTVLVPGGAALGEAMLLTLEDGVTD